MSSLQAFPLSESELVRRAPAPVEIIHGRTLSEIMFGLMRLRPNAGYRDDLEAFLKRLVEDTRLLFCASGAAVALRDDGGNCFWRAKCGESGPQIGRPLNPGAGVSGECLATAQVQFCPDTLLDSRFDAELCRQLQLRSMIVAPIRSAARVEGVLEAWSSDAMAFDRDCAETLRKLADFSGRVTGLGRGFEEGSGRTRVAAFVDAMSSASRRITERTRDFIQLIAGRTCAPTDFTPVPMKLRARGILLGLALSTIVGAVWYIRPASAGSYSQKPLIHHRMRTSTVDHPWSSPAPSQAESKPGPVQGAEQGVTGGQLLSSVRPVYPRAAIEGEIEDTVVLQALVDREGRVEGVSVVKGHPLLASAAVSAVKQWRYEPFLLNNSAIPVTAKINVNFKLR